MMATSLRTICSHAVSHFYLVANVVAALLSCRECFDAMSEAQRNRLEAYIRSNLQKKTMKKVLQVYQQYITYLRMQLL